MNNHLFKVCIYFCYLNNILAHVEDLADAKSQKSGVEIYQTPCSIRRNVIWEKNIHFRVTLYDQIEYMELTAPAAVHTFLRTKYLNVFTTCDVFQHNERQRSLRDTRQSLRIDDFWWQVKPANSATTTTLYIFGFN